MKKLLLSLWALFFLQCQSVDLEQAKQDLMDVDIRFSDYSAQQGMKKAYQEFAHPEGVLLRPNRMPIVGKNKLIAYLSPLSDSSFTLTWIPLSADVAHSGEMGFTYGIYLFKADSATQKGTYVSIWKKDENGQWKYLLDTGNEGLGEE